MNRSRTAVIVAAVLVVAACASSRVPEPSSTPGPASASPAATASLVPSPVASDAPSATTTPSPRASSGNVLTDRCTDNLPCRLTAGTWVTTGSYAFIPGLAFTVPDGWSSHASDAGEFKLIAAEQPDDAIFVWKDVAAIESNGQMPKVLSGVPRTPEGLTASFRNNRDFVVSTPTETTIGDGIPALTYVIGISKAARYSSPDCPSHPACANILKDPDHWGATDFYAIGAPEVVRLYLATIGTAADRHMLVIGLDATDPAALERLTVAAAPIIASIRLPAVITSQ